jgi:hypothetical protein
MNGKQTVDYRVLRSIMTEIRAPSAMMIEATGSEPDPLIIRDVIFNEPFRRRI